jgi:hypothetical protein
MALHMLLQMRRLLKPRTTLLAIVAGARRTATTSSALIHFILQRTHTFEVARNSQLQRKSAAQMLSLHKDRQHASY